jgi:hypothetical protein
MSPRFVRAFVVIGTEAMLCGCFVGVSRVRYSVPYMDDPAVAVHHDHGDSGSSTFSLDDLKLSVYSDNVMNGGDVLLFPIPWSLKTAPRSSKTFKVYLVIRPERDGLVLNPADITLSHSPLEGMKPNRIYYLSECGKSNPEWSGLPIEPIILRRGVCMRFAIEFDIPPPNPAEKFSLQIAGLSLDGAPHGLPEVRFKEARRHDPFGAP